MIILIDLTVAGIDTGSFDLYSNADVYTTPFAQNITRQQLLDGYQATVDNSTITIMLRSLNNVCPGDTFLPVDTTTSTTSSTSTSTTTTTTTTVALAVGQNYQGGIIAYLDNEGGLIVATNDLGSAIWGCEGDYVLNLAGDYLGALDTTIYGGQLNTQEIVGPNGCATLGIAARLCDSYSNGGYSDWYLANENEWFGIAYAYVNPLNGIQNKDNPIFNFSNTSAYWSSNQSELNSSVANNILLAAAPDDAIWASGNKSNTNLVRPIRKFTIV